MNKQKLLATGLLSTVFVAGVLIGSAGRALAERGEGEEKQTSQTYVGWLETELTLNQQQETAIAVILDQYNDDMHDLWSYVRPRSDELRQNARRAIAEILDEDQRVVYSDMNARLDSARAERRRKND